MAEICLERTVLKGRLAGGLHACREASGSGNTRRPSEIPDRRKNALEDTTEEKSSPEAQNRLMHQKGARGSVLTQNSPRTAGLLVASAPSGRERTFRPLGGWGGARELVGQGVVALPAWGTFQETGSAVLGRESKASLNCKGNSGHSKVHNGVYFLLETPTLG